VKNTRARTRIGSGCVQGPPTGKNSYPCPLDQVFDGYLISIPELPSGLHKSAHDHVHTIRCHFNWEKSVIRQGLKAGVWTRILMRGGADNFGGVGVL
jgi:hypothetical protein